MEDLFLNVDLLEELKELVPDPGFILRLIKVAEELPFSEWEKALKDMAKEDACYREAWRIYQLVEDKKLKAYAYEIFTCFIIEYNEFIKICWRASEQRKGKLLI